MKQDTRAESPSQKAGFQDWLGLAAGTLGVLRALVDVSIVNAALPPACQPIGLALTAMTALVGLAVRPMLGGWLTGYLS